MDWFEDRERGDDFNALTRVPPSDFDATLRKKSPENAKNRDARVPQEERSPYWLQQLLQGLFVFLSFCHALHYTKGKGSWLL